MHRVEDLADLPHGSRSPQARPYHSLVPLMEIIAEVLQVGVSSKKVLEMYLELLSKVGSEYHVLVEAELRRIGQATSALLAEAVRRVRKGQVSIEPGYDGEFGTIRVFDTTERERFSGQLSLFEPG